MERLDQVWLRLRHPFRYPPKGHACRWERYDADRAGCVLCGALHRCMDSMAGCQCPLAETDDGGHVCLVTGLCIREVRASATEYMDHVVFETPPEPRSVEDEGLYERVYAVVHWFLTSSGTEGCLRQERERYAAKSRQAFWRVLRQRKKERPYDLPCLLGVVAEVARIEQSSPLCQAPAPGAPPSLVARLVQVCAANIALCLFQVQRMGLKKVCPGARFQSMVVGMLYMARTGLRVGDLFHLPAVAGVHALLPSETYLNCLGVSNKVICDTENEIKSCIRAFAERRR